MALHIPGRLPVWLFWPRVIVALAFAVVVGLVVRVAREPLVVAFAVAYYYGSCNPMPGHKPCPSVPPDGEYVHHVRAIDVLFHLPPDFS